MSSAIIVSLLLFIIVNFYILTSVVSVDTFFYVFLIMSFLTDGLFILLHVVRSSKKNVRHKQLHFDPNKLTIVIICYNGADVIEETIRQAKKHVQVQKIFVVSDASTDDTARIAAATGAKVFINRRNVNKAFSINAIMKRIKTPYTLLLDDDTLIADTFIPTSLLDDGYTAVAFNVMPVETDTFVNALQRFEYRKSMQLGKNLRSSVGAIGNVSGAIGLFHTVDLQRQSARHSGQFGGEDEQRTILAHLEGTGKGVTFTDSTVKTHAPNTVKSLLRQRAFSWNLSVPEMFVLSMKLLLDPRHHFLLKSEKAYGIYLYLTDPLRILFFWVLLTRPIHIFTTYGFYLFLTTLVWLKTGRKDKYYVIMLFPFYSVIMGACRFVAHFYWYKIKFEYFARHKFHRLVPNRRMALEFITIILLNCFLWLTAFQHLSSDLNLMNKLQNNRLDSFDTSLLDYDQQTKLTPNTAFSNEQSGETLVISVAPSDTTQTLARKALVKYLALAKETPINTEEQDRMTAQLAMLFPDAKPGSNEYQTTLTVAQVQRQLGK